MQAVPPRGIWASTLLPLGPDDEIDFACLESALDVLLASGVHGIYTNGTAGEFHTQTEAECDRLQELVAARCTAEGVPFQLGASHPSPPVLLGRITRAAALKPAAIQVILPDWLPLSPDETVTALRRMADTADGVPLILYNPPNATTRLEPEVFAMLADEIPELVGIKVPGGDDDWYRRITATRLSVFVAGHTLASGFARGAAGSYSNVACLSPRGAVRWYEQMHADLPAALEFEQRLRGFFDEHITPLAQAGYCAPALDKTLAAIGNWAPIGTRIRWPHRSVDESAIPALREAARKAVPELFEH